VTLADPEEPTFSVVVAAYQAAGTIRDALASVFTQSELPFEVIVCDDGSTDDIDGALGPFRDLITVLHKPNGGEGSAKNAAAREASGDFVVFLDADDTFLPDRLACLRELSCELPDLDILTTDAWLVVDGELVRRCYTDAWPFEWVDQRREILRRNFIFGLAAVRRKRLIAAGGFDEAILRTTDWDLWIRLILDGARAGAVLEPLAHYNVRPNALSSDRIGMRRGAVQTLTKALGNPLLQADERAVLEDSMEAYRRELRLLEGRRDLIDGAPTVRRRMLGMALDDGLEVRARAAAMLAAMAPRTAGRVQRRRASRAWTGAGGTEVTTSRPVQRAD
jgi:glycosyltransferase involved in cell wall biosynthesis